MCIRDRIAVAAPVLAETRRHGIPDAAVLELAWEEPALAAAAPACVSIAVPGPAFVDASAAAVVLNRPPAASAEPALHAAFQAATRLVIAVAALETFPGRTAVDLAPAGWDGREAPAVGDVQLALLRAADARPEVERSVAGHADRWIEMLAGATFGESSLRLWIFERRDTTATPREVVYDPARVQRWRPDMLARPSVHRRGPLRRFWLRADVFDRSEVWRARLRRRFVSRGRRR